MRSITDNAWLGCRLRLAAWCVAALLAFGSAAHAHDIPNAQVDRSIQVTVRPGHLAVDYEVSLAELTLVRDLRALVESLPSGGPAELFDEYGRVTGPLNAKGLFVTVDGAEVELTARGFDLVVEGHPRFTFHFDAPLPPRGRLVVNDQNFAGSEGTSRLAIRGAGDVALHGDDLHGDVNQIPIRPVWQLSNAEERRTKRVAVTFAPKSVETAKASPRPAAPPVPRPTPPALGSGRLSRLLDRATGLSVVGLWLLSFSFGAIHAFQPGHGKTLVAANAVGETAPGPRTALLALVITLTHTGSVLMIAAALWWAKTTRYGEIHVALTRCAGFVIAAVGLWRLGRHLAGYGEHDEPATHEAAGGGLVGLGIAGGIGPCWDAVGLVVLAGAVGRLALGVVLLLAFGLGMAVILLLVGLLAARLRSMAVPAEREARWEHRLGILSGLALAGIGLYFLNGPS